MCTCSNLAPKCVTCIFRCSRDCCRFYGILADLLPKIPDVPEWPIHQSNQPPDLLPTLPGAPEGHCIGPVNSWIWASWVSSLTTFTYSQWLPVAGIHIASVSNSPNQLERFGLGLERERNHCNRFYNITNPDHCFWARSHLKTRPFQAWLFGSNWVFEFWFYRDMVYMWTIQF